MRLGAFIFSVAQMNDIINCFGRIPAPFILFKEDFVSPHWRAQSQLFSGDYITPSRC